MESLHSLFNLKFKLPLMPSIQTFILFEAYYSFVILLSFNLLNSCQNALQVSDWLWLIRQSFEKEGPILIANAPSFALCKLPQTRKVSVGQCKFFFYWRYVSVEKWRYDLLKTNALAYCEKRWMRSCEAIPFCPCQKNDKFKISFEIKEVSIFLNRPTCKN